MSQDNTSATPDEGINTISVALDTDLSEKSPCASEKAPQDAASHDAASSTSTAISRETQALPAYIAPLIQEPLKLFQLEVLVLSVRKLLVIPGFPSFRSVKSLKGHTFSLHPISVAFNCSIDFLIWSPILNLTNN
jgi:hypothetical protein